MAYTWSQTSKDATILLPLDPEVKARNLEVTFNKNAISVKLKNTSEYLLKGTLQYTIKPSDCIWHIDNQILTIELQKTVGIGWWTCVMKDSPEHLKVDVSKIPPETAKMADLDDEARALVDKMMFDNRQKQLGLPTSDTLKGQEMLNKLSKGQAFC